MENQKLLANEGIPASVFLPVFVLTVADLLCFQTQTAVKKYPQPSGYQKGGIKNEGLMTSTKKAESHSDIQ